MARESPIRTCALVTRRLSDQHCRARLPNGKEVIAHLPRGRTLSLEEGSGVALEMTPFDFDHARIAGESPPPASRELRGLANPESACETN